MTGHRSTTGLQVGIALFLLVSGALGVATALSSEPPGSNLRAVLVADRDPAEPLDISAAATSTTVAATTGTPPTTNPEQVANRNALVEIPEVVIDTIGGRDSVKVVALDRDGSSFADWSGGDIQVSDGRAEIGKGRYVAPDGVSAPIAIVARMSYSEDTRFELVIETGTWNTDDLLRWGVSVDSDSIEPNAWVGKSEAEFESPPLPPVIDDDFWLVLAVDRTTAMLAVVPPGSEAALGAVWSHEWTIDDWELGIEVFSGVVSVDRYYVLTP